MNALLLRLRKTKSLLLVICMVWLLAGCYVLKVVRQPIQVDPNTTVDIQIVIEDDPNSDYTGDGLNGHGLFGVLIPEGWTVEDEIAFQVESEDDQYSATGVLAYDEAQSIALTEKHAAPEGYYWWGAKSLEQINMKYFDSLYFSIRVLTDDKLGNFKLKYAFGDDENAERTPSNILSNDYPIKVGMITGIEDEFAKAKIYPNPSTGKFTLFNEGLQQQPLLLYNAQGQVIQKRELTLGANEMDLCTQKKGTYYLALQNGEKLSTRKVIIY